MNTIQKTTVVLAALFLSLSSSLVAEALDYKGRLIKLNTVGDDVKEVQQCLLDMGFPLPVYGADGWYGQETYDQITSYQRSEGLRYIDGIVGPETAAVLTCEPQEDAQEPDEETEPEEEPSVEAVVESKTTNIPKKTTDNVETEARAISIDGATNDEAEFSFSFSLNAFGNESYVSEYAQDSVVFSVTDATTGSVVYDSDGATQNGSVIYSLSSSASLDGSFYRINEDDTEEFDLSISYNPYGGTPAGEGSYRVQLDGVNYHIGSTGAAATTYNTSNLTKFRTTSVNIVN